MKPCRDNTSVSVLNTPLMCVAKMWKEYLACKNTRHRNRCMASGSRLDPEFTMATTAALSHCARTVFPTQPGPHSAAAITIGRSSLTVIFCSLLAPSPAHFNWNQSRSFRAPHPHDPDASDTMDTLNSGLALFTTDIMEIPFHAVQY